MEICRQTESNSCIRGVFTMVRWILALSGISFAIAFAQSPNTNYTPPKTPWGEPDLQGIWPLNHLIAVPLVRPKQYGTKAYLTDEEVAKAQAALDARNNRFK